MRNFVLGLFVLAFTGCATMMEGIPGFTHTAALMLRQPSEGVSQKRLDIILRVNRIK